MSGFLKIEMQNKAGGSWTDVTNEILALGYTGKTLMPASGAGSCAGSVNAVIRIQRFKDHPGSASTACDITITNRKTFWSNTLYDAREGWIRDDNTTYVANPPNLNYTRMHLGGIMHYVELDIDNLREWLATKRQTNDIMETTGYVVYFSDRRGNHNPDALPTANVETGEYGWEDVVHGEDGTTLHTGEDLNGNSTLETYGRRSWKPSTDTAYWGTDPAQRRACSVRCSLDSDDDLPVDAQRLHRGESRARQPSHLLPPRAEARERQPHEHAERHRRPSQAGTHRRRREPGLHPG